MQRVNYSPPYLLFDIGGTKTRLAISRDGKSIEPPVIMPTKKKFSDQMKKLKDISEDFTGHKPALAVGGIAGSLNKAKDCLWLSPNLPDWSGKNIKQELSEALGLPVLIENDAAMAGLGEANFGSGKDFNIVVYITVSTGVNAVKVVDGKLEKSVYGAEIGHQIINFDVNKDFDSYGRGTLEDYIGGDANEKREGKSAEQIEEIEFWDRIHYEFSVGLHNTILHWSPEAVVLGGQVGLRLNIETVKKHLSDLLISYEAVPAILRSKLGDLAGVWGGLAFMA